MSQKALIADSCIYKQNLSKHLEIKYGEHLGHLHTSLHIWLATQSVQAKAIVSMLFQTGIVRLRIRIFSIYR